MVATRCSYILHGVLLLDALACAFHHLSPHSLPRVPESSEESELSSHTLLSFSCMYHVGMRLSLLFFQIFLIRDVFSINKYSKLEKLLQINEKCTPQDIISNNWISIFKFRKRYVWESPNQKVIFVNSHVDRWTWIIIFYYYRDFNMIQQRFECFYWFLYYANKNENGGSNKKKKKRWRLAVKFGLMHSSFYSPLANSKTVSCLHRYPNFLIESQK